MIFQGTIHLPDDPARLPATMRVAEGRVTIESEGQLISQWRIDRIDMTHRQDGIALLVDGESIIVTPTDRYGFSDAVEAAKEAGPKRRSLLPRRKKSEKGVGAPPTTPSAAGSHNRRTEASVPAPTDDAGTGAVPPASADAPTTTDIGAVASGPTWRPTVPIDELEPIDQSSSPRPAAGRRSLPPVDPPDPSDWRPIDGRVRTGDAGSDPVTDTDRMRDSTAPVSPTGSPVGPSTTPASPDDDRALSDAVRSAKAEPLITGFRKAEPPAPVDLTKEIFGDAANETPKKRGLAGRLADRWLDVSLARRRALLGLAILVLLTLIVPAVVATLLVLAGLVACLVGGAGMADPSYTRKLPPELSEVRLLVSGGIMLVIGFLIGLPAI